MSLITALYTGASGLESSSIELSVVGDNIANSNTIGFKGGRAAFADAMAQNMIGGTNGSAGQRGLGTKLQMIQKILTQGALSSTGLATDLAIQGNGFFAVKGSVAGQTGQYYTRAGQFTIDNKGFLTNLDGMRVQGFTADGAGTINLAGLGDLKVGEATGQPRPTGTITVRANLQSDAALMPAWDVANPTTTSNFSTGITIYDSLGKAHQANVYFRRNGAGDWEWHALADGGGLNGGMPGVQAEIASGTATFDSQGRLTATTTVSNFTPAGAVSPQPLTFNFGTPVPGGTGLDGLTQFASPSAATFLNQDGYTSGDLARINIDNQGRVVGAFTNGQTRVLAQVALASFEAPDQMMRVGANLYGETPAGGPANIGEPGTGTRGSVTAGALEQSNVDLASEFIRMIAAQRGFQANSKTLTTADQLLAELMTIKR
jgi:flagellar hook protein FlgE